jgi:membrane-associated phospholipid phosphatase
MDSQPIIRLRFWLLGGLILLIGTIFFRIEGGKYDIAITSLVYVASNPVGSRFPLAANEPWHFFNEYNDYFTYALAAFLLLMFLIGIIKKDKGEHLRRYGFFGILSVVLGAGLVVNSIFKEMWGRPRPRMTTLWPDTTNPIGRFFMVWEPAFLEDPALVGEGVSFPSGHVSIIASFIVLFYIFMQPELWAMWTGKPKAIFQTIKWGSLLFTFIGGILTGIGRIVAGAHHASDVLWAFGMVFIINALLYYFICRIPRFEQRVVSPQSNSN